MFISTNAMKGDISLTGLLATVRPLGETAPRYFDSANPEVLIERPLPRTPYHLCGREVIQIFEAVDNYEAHCVAYLVDRASRQDIRVKIPKATQPPKEERHNCSDCCCRDF